MPDPDKPASRLVSAETLRKRTLLALSLLNHRATVEGLTPVDVDVLRAVLAGEWDAI